MKKLLRWLSVLPAVLMLLLIFRFSAQDGPSSGSLSYKVSYAIIKLFDRICSSGFSEGELISRAESIQLVVRKLAHITEFFLLTLSFYLPLRIWLPYKGVTITGKQYLYKLILPAFSLSILCAAADEFHQSFVPGRCGTPIDVLVDSVGIIGACLFLIYCNYRIQKRHRACNPHSE
ncbi:MAG: VanZ family protein [Lachnospiraceae bacterium]|nr:VanZ family protein [Lachnospiraceae bacterium]